MSEIKKMLSQHMDWKPIIGSVRDFFSSSYDEAECYLRMNNFPEEPLWTLFYKAESIDFDDTPENWNIKYRSDF